MTDPARSRHDNIAPEAETGPGPLKSAGTGSSSVVAGWDGRSAPSAQGRCPYCDNIVALTAGGQIRPHKALPASILNCDGSFRVVTAVSHSQGVTAAG